MNIENFTLDVIARHQTWYLLHNNYQNDITIIRPTPTGPESYTDYSAYRMADNRILIGFNKLVGTVLSQGLIALGDDGEEYITTQIWERISDICNIAPPVDEPGTFVFVDSQPIVAPNIDWRCDTQYYGPMPFPDLNGVRTNPTEEQSVITVFEPIISASGLAHIVYLRRKDFSQQRLEFIDNALTPAVCTTLGECVKLIHEWALMAEEPFNNTEDIAIKAKLFCNHFDIHHELIRPYPNMQIMKFLSGDSQARVRPDNAIAPQDDLIRFIQDNVSHIKLSRLVEINPNIWNYQEIVRIEELELQNKIDNFISQHIKNMPSGINYSNVEDCIPYAVKKNLLPFLKEWLRLFDL